MKVHLIAIGGSAMHNLALELYRQGHQVSGSDDEFFEPSRSRLDQAGLLPPAAGWVPERIHAGLDCVILGMHARRNNPELLRAQELDIPVYSYPEFLYQQSQHKTRVVIAGSHGKTTITAMILHVLHYHGRDADYMVGAQLEGFDTMVRLTEHNEFIILEGDEYLSSPLDSRPKFLHYHPNIALLSGIAWDHYNVFPQYQQYYHQFELLLQAVVPGGAVVYNEADPEVRQVMDECQNEVKKFPYGYPEYTVEQGQFSLQTPEGPIPLQIFGRHNMNNLEGARWICNQIGLTNEEFYEAMVEFEGASMRLEPLWEEGDRRAFRDYAHAPSKVRASVAAVAEAFPQQPVYACLELHTFSSLSRDFIRHYQGTLGHATEALVYFNPQVVAHKKLPALSIDDVRQAFDDPRLVVANSSQEVRAWARKKLRSEGTLLIMTSGNFDGLDWPAELARW